MPTLGRPKFQGVLPAILLDEGRIISAELSVLPVMSGGGQLNNGGKFEKILNYSAFYLLACLLSLIRIASHGEVELYSA